MKIKRIITILILIIICFITTTSNASFSINKADIYIKARAKTCLKLTSNNGPIGVTKVFYNNNGVEYPAYCINPELPGVGEYPGYQVTVEDVVNNPQVWRVITQGYPYKTLEQLGLNDEDEAYTATKQAIYCVINNYSLSRYGAVGEEGVRTLNAMTKMVEYARNSNETKPSNNIKILESSEWELDNTNQNIVKTFEIKTECSSPEFEINIQNNKEETIKILDINGNITNKVKENKFKILVPISSMEKDETIPITVKAKLATYPILYGKSQDPNLQSYALAGEIYEMGEGKIETKYFKNETRLKIIKVDKEGHKKIEGIEFNILDENGNIKYSNLKTNKEGEILIENMLPGKYFIEEVNTINGYQKLEEKIEIDLTLNEELTITIENEKEKIEPKKEKSYSERITKLPVTGM